MADKRIEVPAGMLEAACNKSPRLGTVSVEAAIEAALLWQREHPPVPTRKQCAEMWRAAESYGERFCSEWVRRMFDTPEPEVPEAIMEIVDNLFRNGAGKEAERLVLTSQDGRDLGGWCRAAVTDQIIEAFRRGQRAGSK